MTDNLPNAPSPIETIRPEVQKPPETIVPLIPDSTDTILPQEEVKQDIKNDNVSAGRIVDKRTGHEKLDAVSTIADSLTQAADEEEAEFIQGVEAEHNPEKPTS